MWITKEFKSLAAMKAWLEIHGDSIQWTELFINNGYALEYRKLRVVY